MPLRLLGDDVTVGPVTAADTLAALAAQRWPDLTLAAMSTADRTRVEERVFDPFDPLDLRHLWYAATVVTRAVTGMDWAPACRVAATVHAQWFWFQAWAIRHGFNPANEPVDRVLAGGYLWMVEAQENADEVQALDAKLFGIDPATVVFGARVNGRRLARFRRSPHRRPLKAS